MRVSQRDYLIMTFEHREKPITNLESLHPTDVTAVNGMPDLVQVFVNDSRWWQNASFALPFIGCLLSIIIGFISGSAEAIGFGLFLGVVSLIMFPVVLLTWRATATVVVLRKQGAISMHRGRVLEEFRWSELRRIDRVEYLGNTRHKLLYGDEDRFLVIENEVEDADALVDAAFELSGLPRQEDSL